MSAPRNSRPRQQSQAKKGGCLKFMAVGCILFLAIGGLGVWWTYNKVKDFIDHPEANMAEIAFTAFVESCNLPEKDKESLLVPVREFIADCKAEKYTDEEIGYIAIEILDQRVSVVITLHLFDLAYIEEAGLDERKYEIAKRIMSRYREGFRSGSIVAGESRFSEVNDIISDSVTTTKPDGGIHTEVTYKENISMEELKKCLAIMKEAADAAQIEDKKFDLDLAKVMRDAIARGSKKYKEAKAEEAKTSEVETTTTP